MFNAAKESLQIFMCSDVCFKPMLNVFDFQKLNIYLFRYDCFANLFTVILNKKQ